MKRKIKIILVSVTACIIAITIFATGGEKKNKKIDKSKKSDLQTCIQTKSKTTPKLIKTGNVIVSKTKTPEKIVYDASNKREAIIGYFDKNKKDNPFDNIFHIQIDTIIKPIYTAFLEYELFGLEDFTSVCKSINNQISAGGFLVKKNERWSRQQEQINIHHLKAGQNIVRFTVPDNANYGYKVRNVRIIFKSAVTSDENRRLVINQPNTFTFYKKFGYIQGFVSGKGSETAVIKVNEKKFSNNDGNFEGMIEKN